MPTNLLTALLAAADAVASPPPSPLPPPVHVNGSALEDAVVEATRAFLRADAAGARAALDKAEEACRRLAYDDKPAWTRTIVNDDIALHMALEKAREMASRGEIDRAVETLVWVGRTCRECHARAADAEGKLPLEKRKPLKNTPVPVP